MGCKGVFDKYQHDVIAMEGDAKEMKVCLNCLTEYRDECEYCHDCGKTLSILSESHIKMLKKLKNPVALITLEDRKERALLKDLLTFYNIVFCSVETDEIGAAYGLETLYVEKNRLDIANPVINEFQADLSLIRENADQKAKMIKPVLLITVNDSMGIDAWDLLCFLEEHSITGYFERERTFGMGSRVALNGIMDGRIFIEEFVYVDEMYWDEAKMLLAKFLVQEPEEHINLEGAEEKEEWKKTEYDDYESLSDMLKRLLGRWLT